MAISGGARPVSRACRLATVRPALSSDDSWLGPAAGCPAWAPGSLRRQRSTLRSRFGCPGMLVGSRLQGRTHLAAASCAGPGQQAPHQAASKQGRTRTRLPAAPAGRHRPGRRTARIWSLLPCWAAHGPAQPQTLAQALLQPAAGRMRQMSGLPPSCCERAGSLLPPLQGLAGPQTGWSQLVPSEPLSRLQLRAHAGRRAGSLERLLAQCVVQVEAEASRCLLLRAGLPAAAGSGLPGAAALQAGHSWLLPVDRCSCGMVLSAPGHACTQAGSQAETTVDKGTWQPQLPEHGHSRQAGLTERPHPTSGAVLGSTAASRPCSSVYGTRRCSRVGGAMLKISTSAGAAVLCAHTVREAVPQWGCSSRTADALEC